MGEQPGHAIAIFRVGNSDQFFQKTGFDVFYNRISNTRCL